MQPDVGAVHTSRPLTNVSVMFIQDASAYVADRVFLNVPSEKQADIYYKIPRGYFLRNAVKERAPGAPTESAGYEIETDSFTCKVYGLDHPIPDERRANTDNPLNADRNGAQFLTQLAMTNREKVWADAVFKTGVWTTDVTGNTSSSAYGSDTVEQWDRDTSTPIEDVKFYQRKMMRMTGKKFNVLTLGAAVWDWLTRHPDILARVIPGGTNVTPAMVTKAAVAALFGVDEILVSEATYNSAAEGQTDVYAFVLNQRGALLTYRPPAAGIETAAAGYTFSWTGWHGMSKMGHRIRKFREERRLTDYVAIDMAYTHKVVAADLGVFFTDIIASANAS